MRVQKNKRAVFKLCLNLLNGGSTIIDERNDFLRYLKMYLFVECFGRKAHETWHASVLLTTLSVENVISTEISYAPATVRTLTML